jgi:Domain of unknown function (DU1801)
VARSDAATPDAYLAELEPGRAAELGRVRDAVNAAMPDGYVERMVWGMISWEVPIDVSGPTYNKQPLVYAALAAQKNYNALYLNCVYASAERTERLREAFAAAGKKLDMGKSCIRFQRADDLPLDAIAREIGSTTPEEFARFNAAARA